MFQVQIPLGGLPVNIVLVGDKVQGGVVFVKVAPVGLIVDQPEDKTKAMAVFTEDNFTICSQQMGEPIDQFEYDTAYNYKVIPAMLQWLKQQNLQEPTNIVFG